MLFADLNAVGLGKTAVADGTSEVLSAVEDMAGWDEITFVVNHADVDAAAVMTYTVKENSADSTSSPTPTAVSLTSVSGLGSVSTGALVITESSGSLDNKTLVINVARGAFTERYVFLSITCTVESHEIVSIQTIKSRPRDVPVSHDSEVVAVAVGYA